MTYEYSYWRWVLCTMLLLWDASTKFSNPYSHPFRKYHHWQNPVLVHIAMALEAKAEHRYKNGSRSTYFGALSEIDRSPPNIQGIGTIRTGAQWVFRLTVDLSLVTLRAAHSRCKPSFGRVRGPSLPLHVASTAQAYPDHDSSSASYRGSDFRALVLDSSYRPIDVSTHSILPTHFSGRIAMASPSLVGHNNVLIPATTDMLS
jgi:hypothetical protein